MNPFKKLLSQTAIYGLSSVIGRLLNYLLVPLYTRVFIPEDYGVITEMYAYLAFFLIFLTYGMETTFFRFSNKYKKRNVYSTALISVLTTALLFLFFINFKTETIANATGNVGSEKLIVWLSFIIFLDVVSAIPFARLRNQNKAVRFSIIKLINILVNIALNIYFVIIMHCGFEYVFIANLISSTITLFLLTPELVYINWVFDAKLYRKMIRYSLPLLFVGLAGMTNEAIDRILLKFYISDTNVAMSELGIYGAFYKLSIIMTLFIQTFRYAAEPFFFSQEKSENNVKIYAQVLNYFVITTATIFLCVIIFFDVAINFIGEDFRDERGFKVVSILLLANMFLGIYYNLSIWYKLIDKTYYGAILSIFGAIITLILNIYLIPKISFVGSAWATLICYFLMALASLLLSKKQFPIPYNIKRITFYILSMLAIYFIVLNTDFSMLVDTIWIALFLLMAFIIEKPKKSINFE
ncbi:MAG: polysaccharide biosynthesis protein [Flavobacteriales bacterium]|nr:polysaccharide biosynthesis protein [Flavobacteriales bacterium]